MFVGVELVGVVAGFAHALGRWLGYRSSQPVYLSVWTGVTLILIPTMAGEAFELAGGPLGVVAVVLALTGVFVEYAAWTTGLGAIVLNRFGIPLPSGAAPAAPSPPLSPGSDAESPARPSQDGLLVSFGARPMDHWFWVILRVSTADEETP